MQMILLYYDPRGETILNTTYNNSVVVKSIKPHMAEVERVRQLEMKLDTLKNTAQHNHVVGVPLKCNMLWQVDIKKPSLLLCLF